MVTSEKQVEFKYPPKVATAKAVFLDRDGTLNVDSGYVHRIADWIWIPGAIAAVGLLKRAGYLIVIVTNQAGIARGLYNEDNLRSLHDWVQADLRQYDLEVDAFYHCPHHPDFGARRDCSCRKPKPGMLLAAAQDLRVDLRASWMVGDKASDIEAGLAAGVRTVHVMSGSGEGIHDIPPEAHLVADLLEAAKFIASLPVVDSSSPGGRS